jgi:hypothetical protein
MKKPLAQRLQEFPLSARVFLNDLDNFFHVARRLASRGRLLIARNGFVHLPFHFESPSNNRVWLPEPNFPVGASVGLIYVSAEGYMRSQHQTSPQLSPKGQDVKLGPNKARRGFVSSAARAANL